MEILTHVIGWGVVFGGLGFIAGGIAVRRTALGVLDKAEANLVKAQRLSKHAAAVIADWQAKTRERLEAVAAGVDDKPDEPRVH